MKYTLHIDKSHDEERTVFVHEKTPLIERIEALIEEDGRSSKIVGYKSEEIVVLDPREIFCFTLEDKKLYAITKRGRYLLKMRLYEIEEHLPPSFIKINQSAIANLDLVDRFSAAIGAGLEIHFKNGHKDYVSRRQIKLLKERLGIK